MSTKKIKQYYIAYFDILGYKNFFEDKNNNALEFLQGVMAVCAKTKDEAYFNSHLFNADFKVKTFSDNFIILLEPPGGVPDYHVLRIFSNLLSQLQFEFLEKQSILIRGGLTKGKAYIDDSIVFGDGLIKAVELESKTAIFPRIVLDDDCFDNNTLEDLCCNSFVAKDEDERYYIDYLGYAFSSPTIFEYERVRKAVASLVKKHGKFHRPLKDPKKITDTEKTISKYAWLLCKFNEQCKENNLAEIPYKLTFNYRYMKTEIVLE